MTQPRRNMIPGLAVLCILLVVVAARSKEATRTWLEGITEAGSPAAGAEPLTGTASVIDGDTLEIRGQRIRLHGMDAPESGQTCTGADGQPWRCGQAAALALSDRIGRAPVTCTGRDTDRYGRPVAVCSVARDGTRNGAPDGGSLNAWMVRQGHAVAYRRYAMDYAGEEALARAEGRGLWAGTFVMPWDWRKGRRNGASPAAQDGAQNGAQNGTRDPGCAIKGNINGSGDRIYHLPGQQHYDRTRINTTRGERWFCSEAEARAAGWRRARR